MSGKALIPLIVGLCMGLLAIKFGMDTLKKAQGGAQAEQVESETRKVVRAIEDIGESRRIIREVLELVETADKPKSSDPDFEDIEQLMDRVSWKFIPSGTIIRSSMLAEPGTLPGVPGKIEAGYRAVSLRIDEVTGVAFNVRPGAWVDVIVVMDVIDPGTRKRETISEVVLQHIQVAAVGLSAAGGGTAATKNKMARSATLLVPEKDVPKLHLAATKGKVTLSMRGKHDIEKTDRYTARDSELFSHDVDEKEEPAEKPDGAKVNLAQLAAMFRNSAMQPVEEEPDPPFTMMIARGSPNPGQFPFIQRVTYENADSWTVLAVTQGLPSPSRMKMRAEPKKVNPNMRWSLTGANDGEKNKAGEPDNANQPDEEGDWNAGVDQDEQEDWSEGQELDGGE